MVMRYFSDRPALAVIFLACVLTACAGGRGGQEVVDKRGRMTAAGGIYKIGTPYKIEGQWYFPREDTSYVNEGIASWYGTKFHGRRTANGEIFDMNLITAAHPTLPMPVRARVTNLENDRSIIVRINDRGPFAKDREIDLSRRAAEMLGFMQQGTAQVRVEYLGRAALYDSAGRPISGQPPDVFIAEKPPTPEDARRVASAAPVDDVAAYDLDGRPVPVRHSQYETRYAVQVGVFSSRENAEQLKARLERIAPVDIVEFELDGNTMFRVKMGGANIRADARLVLDRLIGAGHQDAVIIEQ